MTTNDVKRRSLLAVLVVAVVSLPLAAGSIATAKPEEVGLSTEAGLAPRSQGNLRPADGDGRLHSESGREWSSSPRLRERRDAGNHGIEELGRVKEG